MVTMKALVWSDGTGASVVRLSVPPGMDADEYAAHVDAQRAMVVPDGCDCAVVDADSLPGRDWTGALRVVDGAVVPDMTAARDVTRERLRRDRVASFAALDVEVQKALINEDKAVARAAERKRETLRNATQHPAIMKASSIADLAAITLDTVTR